VKNYEQIYTKYTFYNHFCIKYTLYNQFCTKYTLYNPVLYRQLEKIYKILSVNNNSMIKVFDSSYT